MHIRLSWSKRVGPPLEATAVPADQPGTTAHTDATGGGWSYFRIRNCVLSIWKDILEQEQGIRLVRRLRRGREDSRYRRRRPLDPVASEDARLLGVAATLGLSLWEEDLSLSPR